MNDQEKYSRMNPQNRKDAGQEQMQNKKNEQTQNKKNRQDQFWLLHICQASKSKNTVLGEDPLPTRYFNN